MVIFIIYIFSCDDSCVTNSNGIIAGPVSHLQFLLTKKLLRILKHYTQDKSLCPESGLYSHYSKAHLPMLSVLGCPHFIFWFYF